MSAVNIAEELNVAVPDRADATTTHPTRPFLWSIRRELWESPTIRRCSRRRRIDRDPRHPLHCRSLQRSIPVAGRA